MQELGSSNKLFYYTFVGRSTFNMQLILQFKEDVDVSLLRRAIDVSLPRFPEFAMTPRRRDGHLYAMENSKGAVLRAEDYKPHSLAGDDCNGYLFYFSYEGKTLRISWFHGLSDFRGFLVLVRTILYEYALLLGRSFPPENLDKLSGGIRLSPPDFSSGREDAWDPYGKYSRDVQLPKDGKPPLCAAAIHKQQYGEECSELNCYEIECSTPDYLRRAKELGGSCASLLSATVSAATFRLDEVDGSRPVVSMLPVDLRPLFSSRTLVNFSDGILLPLFKEDLTLSLEKRCEKLRSSMTGQICPEAFLGVMKAKVEQVRSFEEMGGELLRKTIEQNISLAPAGGFTPLTYALTYPGNLSMGPGLDELLFDASIRGFARASSVIASSFGNTFRILITYRSDNPEWPEAIFREIQALGLESRMQHLGKLKGDFLNPESFLPELSCYRATIEK